MTPDPQAKLKVGLLLAIGVCLIVVTVGFISCALQVESGVEAASRGELSSAPR